MNSISGGKNATISTDFELYNVSSNYIKLRFVGFFCFFLESPETLWFHLFCCCHETIRYQTLRRKKHALASVFISDFKESPVSQSCDFIRCLSSVLGLTEKELEFSGHYRSTLPGASNVLLQLSAYDVWHGGTSVDLESILLTPS